MRHFKHPSTFAAPHLAIGVRRIQSVIVVIAITIILLGCFREVYVFNIGSRGELGAFALFDTGNNLASWFESVLLLYAAAMLGFIAVQTRRETDQDWRRWALLGGLFLVLSVDEVVNAHAMLLGPIWHAGQHGPVFALWLPLAPALALGAYLFPMLKRLPRHRAVHFALCASIFVGGAIVLDAAATTLSWSYGTASLSYVVASLSEESMEVIGAAGLCGALIGYTQERWPMWGIRFV